MKDAHHHTVALLSQVWHVDMPLFPPPPTLGATSPPSQLHTACIGGLTSLLMIGTRSYDEVAAWSVHTHTAEHSRLNQWSLLGAGTCALLATPGTGSLLFQHTTPWYVRAGGGAGVGTAIGILAFALSRHPSIKPYLRYLPETMQPLMEEAQSTEQSNSK